jgi:transposase-like protein
MRVKYDPETKAKAIRLVREHAGDYPSEYAAITAVARRLGMVSNPRPVGARGLP